MKVKDWIELAWDGVSFCEHVNESFQFFKNGKLSGAVE